MKSRSDRSGLEAALRRCGSITRRQARNFYYGLKLAPESKRSALYVLYAWMREADDIVDLHVRRDGATAQGELSEFAEHTRQALRGEMPTVEREHLWRGLEFLRRQFLVNEKHFQSMIQGQVRDLEHVGFEHFDDLREYCELVASSVGLLCVQIWGSRQEGAAAFAVDRGIALQLTNVLRDYAEDYDRGRIYLPAEDFHTHVITPQILRVWSEPARCARFVAAQVARARDYYTRSAALEEQIEPDCRPVLEAMTTIYSSLLERVAADPRRAMSGRRVRLSPWRKLVIAGRAARAAKQARTIAGVSSSRAAEHRA